VDVEETALQQIVAQMLHLVVAQPHRADVLHEEDRAMREHRVGELDDDVVWLSGLIEANANERQLGEAYGKVVVGAGIVGPPAHAAVFATIAAVEAAAVVEAAVEVRPLRPLRRLAPSAEAESAAAAYPDALRRRKRRGDRDHDGDQRDVTTAGRREAHGRLGPF